jgi:hypothetical protein
VAGADGPDGHSLVHEEEKGAEGAGRKKKQRHSRVRQQQVRHRHGRKKLRRRSFYKNCYYN